METQLDQNITLRAMVAKHTDFLVVGILFVFYLFFANYFAWGLTFVNGGGISTLPTSGGSDPYYNFYLILHFLSTGHWLVHDPALNFPFGSTNPRNPFFHVMLVFVAEVLSPIFGAKMAAFYAFEEFDAVFGALLIIPVYLVTKELFGKRAGYISAFLYTLMPSNLSAGILSGGRMHTPELIFAFFTIYFFAMAIKYSGKGRILENLKDFRTLPSRLMNFYHENRKSTTYALLAGASLGGLMLAWQGYAYIEAIILIYIVIQLIANLILKRPTGYITFYFALFIILGFAMGAYYYQAIGEGPGWYNAELLIGILIILFSAVINIIGRRPWILIIPVLIVVAAVGIVGMDFFAPSLFHTLISGDGYFIKTRVYSTIAEAQAPALGSYISGFGVAQFIFGIAGMIYVVYLYLKERKEEVLFIMVFSLVSIYMSFAAARFNITAAPAYAILGGAIIMYFAKMARVDDLKNRKNVGYGSVRKSIKGNIKWVQAAFVVIIALVLLVPSGLSMVSASVPANSAAQVNTQLGSAIPAFLKGTNNTTVSFAGALGVPIDNATQPIALSLAWLSSQDTNLPLTEKPAYVSWWDYGFQELYQGQHPTVADDFQQGIPQAGELLMAQNQSQDIALFIAIDLQANFQQNGDHFSSNITNTLISKLGVNEYRIILNASKNPGAFTQTVLSSPAIYGQYIRSITSANVYYAFMKGNLSYNFPTTTLVNLYQSVEQETGYKIGYIQIDHNLFPSSATNPGIFYAPAYLTYTPSYTSTGGEVIPTEYYNVYATTTNGTFPLNQLSSTAVPISYNIQYTPQFYNTSIYRFTIGYPPSAVSQTNGIPGVDYGQSTDTVMPAWNMSNFEIVYENSLYNPYKNYQAHPNDFKEIPLQEAYKLQKENNGTVIMFSSASQMLSYSDPIVEYFPGAIVQGKVTTPDGAPVPDVRVTIFDQYGIPHQTVLTNSKGDYSLMAVPGNDTLIYSTGTLNQQYLIGSNSVGDRTITVSKSQAERTTTGYNSTTGLPDYYFTENFNVSSSTVSGSAHYSYQQVTNVTSGGSNAITSTPINTGNVILRNSTYNLTYNLTMKDGSWSLKDVPPLSYEASLYTGGNYFSNVEMVNVTLGSNVVYNIQVPFDVAFVNTTVAGKPVTGMSVTATTNNGMVWSSEVSNSTGVAKLFVTPGTYEVRVSGNSTGSYPVKVTFNNWNENTSVNLTPEPAALVSVNVAGSRGNTSVVLYHDGQLASPLIMSNSGKETFRSIVPYGTYTLYAVSGNLSYLRTLQITSNTTITVSLVPSGNLTITSHIHGVSAYSGYYEILSSSVLLEDQFLTNHTFTMLVPHGYYTVSGLGTYTGNTLSGMDQLNTGRNTYVNLSLQYNLSVTALPFINSNTATGYSTSSSAFSGLAVLLYDNVPISFQPINLKGYAQLFYPSYASGMTNLNYSGAFFDNFSAKASSGTVNLPLTPRTIGFSVQVMGNNYLPSDITASFVGNNGVFNYTSSTGFMNVKLQPSVYVLNISQKNYEIVSTPAFMSVVTGMPSAVSINSSAYSDITVQNSTEVFLFNSSGIAADNVQHLLDATYTLYAFNSSRGVYLSTLKVNGNARIEPAFTNYYTVSLANSLGATSGTYYISADNLNMSFPAGNVSLPVGTYSVSYIQRASNDTGSYLINGTSSFDLTGNMILNLKVSQSEVYSTLRGYLTYDGSPAPYATVMILNSTGNTVVKGNSNYQGYYSMTVPSGNYTAYILDNATGSGYFGSVTVPGFADVVYQNETLVPAFREYITVNLGTSIINHLVTASIGTDVYAFNSSVGSLILPRGNYTFSSTLSSTTNASNGTVISVSYSQSETIYVNSPGSLQISLQLVVYHAFNLKLTSPIQTISPGGTMDGNVTLTNQGNSLENITLSSGSSSWIVKFNKSGVDLKPGQSANLSMNATLTGNIPYGKESIPVLLKYSGGNTTVKVPVNIEKVSNYTVVQNISSMTNGTELYLPITIKNTGNSPIAVNLSISTNSSVSSSPADYGWSSAFVYNGTYISRNLSSTVYANITVPFGQSKVIYIVLTPSSTSNVIKSFSFTLSTRGADHYENITVSAATPSLSSVSPYPVGPGVIGNYTGDPYESLIIGLVVIAVAVVAGVFVAGYRGRKK